MQNQKMPALFLGHGSPMFAIQPNDFTKEWEIIGKKIQKPKCIIVISAHWIKNKTFVTVNERQKTIHDFYGFPKALFDVKYEPEGSQYYTERVKNILLQEGVEGSDSWGLDHGSWSVLKYLYPDANIPTIQLSIKKDQSSLYYYNIGKQLSVLRNEGVLFIGSGNIVHNLSYASTSEGAPYDFAVNFNNSITKLLNEEKIEEILSYQNIKDSDLATDEHFLPFLYILGMKNQTDKIKIFNNKISIKSVSMLSVSIETEGI